jgi:hypothetical protein
MLGECHRCGLLVVLHLWTDSASKCLVLVAHEDRPSLELALSFVAFVDSLPFNDSIWVVASKRALPFGS